MIILDSSEVNIHQLTSLQQFVNVTKIKRKKKKKNLKIPLKWITIFNMIYAEITLSKIFH